MAITSLIALGCNGPAAAPAKGGGGPVEDAASALRARRFDAAIADADNYLRAQPNGPQSAEAAYYKGQAFQRKEVADLNERRQNLFEAKSAYLRALNGRPTRELEGDIRLGLSSVALFQDDFPTCIDQATAAQRLVDAPDAKAGLLYNMGLAQQRLGRFTDADQTFRQLIQRYPGTRQAGDAKLHLGQTHFYVQLATYASPADADRAMVSLRSGGTYVTRSANAQGNPVLAVGPFSTYASACRQRDALLGAYPTAFILPP